MRIFAKRLRCALGVLLGAPCVVSRTIEVNSISSNSGQSGSKLVFLWEFAFYTLISPSVHNGL